ncbi:MAG: SBBP repeat-containing protein [Bacteroidia bacterium]|nr:SBBP repeat-containing protein [Bacteroidia bacterium]
MKKFIQFLFLILVIAINANANNINKPISSQYGFIENKGQIIDQNNNPNPSVLYLYNGNGLRVQLRKDGFSYEVINTIKTPKAIIDERPKGKFVSQADSFYITYQTHRVDINFKDGNKNATLKSYQPANDFINYYTTGTSEEGVTNVHHYQKVVYENVYPNIDIEFVLNDAANRGKFKYNFIVKPNGNLADIKLAFLGANRTSLNQAGNILIETAYGNIEENIPLSYVINENNTHSTIKANFMVFDNNIYSIKAENYNHNQTLVIDPTNWATYFGQSGDNIGAEIATDDSGNVIITGSTQSGSAIATIGAHQTVFGGITHDAFISKFNSNGTLLWATFYGGSGYEMGRGIVTDSVGNIILTGQTGSSNAIVTIGAHQTTLGGGTFDAFVAKFNSNGVRQWATYYGGNNNDVGYGITIDANENIIIVGQTFSSNVIATIGAHQTVYGGAGDAFVAKFNSNGIRLWATYFGGTNADKGNGIITDTSGNIIITGQTNSTNGITTTGTHQTLNGGGSFDAFIAKFNSNGIRQWATYYGGSNSDSGEGIIKDTLGNIIITGYTNSTNSIATIGAHQTSFGGVYDAFIAKFNANGIRQWGTYYGGSNEDDGYGITSDVNANIIITGDAGSLSSITTTGAHQTTFGGGNSDVFIAKFNTNGIRQWATYYGGSDNDYSIGITTDLSGNIIITGATLSTNGIATFGSYQTIHGGDQDVYIAKYSNKGTLPVKLISFNATLANEKVNCTWETASEINNDYFTIERSKDGNGFESLGNVKGQGNSNSNTRYSYIDNNPFSGISYYRLKQTDFDGKYTYSDIKKVGLDKELGSEISLYYENNNPIVKINSLTESNTIIELINLNGTKLLSNEQQIIKGENTFAINGNIMAGLYLIKVQVENEVKCFKVWIR